MNNNVNVLVPQLEDMESVPGVTRAQIMAKIIDILGQMDGPLRVPYKAYTADGVADMTKTLHLLGSGIDITGFTPLYIGQVAIIICTDSGTDATATTGAGVTWEGSNDKATFPDTDDLLVVIASSLTRWHILVNLTGVTFS